MFASEKTFFAIKKNVIVNGLVQGKPTGNYSFFKPSNMVFLRHFPLNHVCEPCKFKVVPIFSARKKQHLAISYWFIYNALLYPKNASLNTSSLGSKAAPFVPGTFSCRFQSSSSRRFCSKTSGCNFRRAPFFWELKSLMIPGIFEKAVISTLW